jgi:hypothetical protein
VFLTAWFVICWIILKKQMQTRSKNIHVQMPDERILEVFYYCNDSKIPESEIGKFTKLFIQLDDCITTIKIEKSICQNTKELEHIVQRKVINERGHLC